MPDTDVQHNSLPSQDSNNALKIASPIMMSDEDDEERNLVVVHENPAGDDEENDPGERKTSASSRDPDEDDAGENDVVVNDVNKKNKSGKNHRDAEMTNFSPTTDVEKKETKSRSKLFEEVLCGVFFVINYHDFHA